MSRHDVAQGEMTQLAKIFDRAGEDIVAWPFALFVRSFAHKINPWIRR
jgi:hypothetical protein